MMATASSAFVGTALPELRLTWRCVGCRRIVARLQYDGHSVIEVVHHCKGSPLNRLPDHTDRLRVEGERPH